MRIDGASGNVGIGTSSPSYKLDVASTVQIRAGESLRLQNVAGSSAATMQCAGAGGNSDLGFSTAGSERMRIDSSGNVGIGTSSPNSYSGYGAMTINGTTGSLLDFEINGTVTGELYADSGITGLGIGLQAVGSRIIHFKTNNQERMRITNDGDIFIGTGGVAPSSSQSGFAIQDNAGKCLVQQATSDAGTNTCNQFINPNGVVGSISTTGSSTSFSTSSDYRLKTDAQPMTGASARVQALNPVNFEWISSGERVDGFLAHEAQAVVPECVTGTKDAMRDEEYEVTAAIEATYDDDGNELTAAVEAVMGTRSVPDMQGIDQSKLVPLLTAALQEALTEITALKARVTALEG